ncbi:hypothetical protein DAEQUDRAFT_728339 [Daedalea quercina L-15889]|uniref:Uncharacterized protein n=1 Tax=Daedalea quercina L-15889 TaxID=1314783 RepID=A0A165PDA8_9APHY|nr:hypothetical protein DAEQUDRAFT_728339 [Daedalea quercina L-15889]
MRSVTANRLPPKDKPRKHCRELKKITFGRVIQCRTGHGYFGEYYPYHVPSDSNDCSCGAPLRTCSHIIKDCPRYESHRDTLRATCSRIVPSTEPSNAV